MRKLILIKSYCFFLLGISAQSNFHDSVYSANEKIYNFCFLSADSAIQNLSGYHPNDYLAKLLSANYYWWQIITGHDTTETRNKYFEELNKSLTLLESKKKTGYSNDSLYALITAYAYKARIQSLNNQYFSALAQLNNCIAEVKQSFGKEEEYEWFLLTSGMYNYYIEAVKKNYPFLIPYLIFLPEGNQSSGIAFLEGACGSKNSLLRTEAKYFLLKIYLEEEKKYALAREYSELLLGEYPANLLYRYYQFKTFLKEKNIEGATRELGLLKYYADRNQQLSEKQKSHFLLIAKEDLKKYYTEKNKK